MESIKLLKCVPIATLGLLDSFGFVESCRSSLGGRLRRRRGLFFERRWGCNGFILSNFDAPELLPVVSAWNDWRYLWKSPESAACPPAGFRNSSKKETDWQSRNSENNRGVFEFRLKIAEFSPKHANLAKTQGINRELAGFLFTSLSTKHLKPFRVEFQENNRQRSVIFCGSATKAPSTQFNRAQHSRLLSTLL